MSDPRPSPAIYAETISVTEIMVTPKYSSKSLSQTISYINPAAPERRKRMANRYKMRTRCFGTGMALIINREPSLRRVILQYPLEGAQQIAALFESAFPQFR